MKTIKYFVVERDSGSNHAYLLGKFSSPELAIEKCLSSRLLTDHIIWDWQHNLKEKLTEFDNVNVDFKNDTVSDLKLSYDGDKILYTAKIKVNCSNNKVIPEVKEEGKPYQAEKTEIVDKTEKTVEVDGFFYSYWKTLELDGVPTQYGKME